MNKNVNEKKSFSVLSMIATELLIFYLVLQIGDTIYILGDFSMVVTRYIPVSIVTVILTYFLIKSGAKKSFTSDKDSFCKKIMIIPLIVAVILLAYGLISVNSNISEFTNEYKSLYSHMSENSAKQIIEEAKNNAIISWIITSVLYLAFSEGTSIFIKNKIDSMLNEDDSNQFVKTQVLQHVIEKTEDSNTNNANENNTSADNTNNVVKNIKWDL